VTHDHRTLSFADRIIRIEDGRIVADERPGDSKAVDHSAAAVAEPQYTIRKTAASRRDGNKSYA
jgi:ABC-type lipoprotein export system ATPase subunit